MRWVPPRGVYHDVVGVSKGVGCFPPPLWWLGFSRMLSCSRAPKKILRRLPADLRRRILATLHDPEAEPRPHGCKMLTGYDLYGVRVDSWRIVYRIEDERLIVLVVAIAPRGGVYKDSGSVPPGGFEPPSPP
ncbi:MAG: type II toxin-antitoxin system RelE/ParE family toxin [Anaerolineae bacterium]|nr:type II toxin-antitoxin system RelE/ParE family toxin [Anaerolineae bacterium]